MHHWSQKADMVMKDLKRFYPGRSQTFYENTAYSAFTRLEQLYADNSNLKPEQRLLKLGQESLRESTKGHANAKIMHHALIRAWKYTHEKHDSNIRNTPRIQAIDKTISNVLLKLEKPTDVSKGLDRSVEPRRNIDNPTAVGRDKVQLEATTQITAGEDPKKHKGKKYKVLRPTASDIPSTQGIRMSNASVYTMDPEVKESNIRGQVMRQGTERLSRFVRNKAIKAKPPKIASSGKEQLAGLGAKVSGQMILE
tara:strand:+ start:347 stop:1105 length:759 start_codon:yes stop_codon:yes gene_type:complete